MKKTTIIIGFFGLMTAAAVIASCSGKRSPGTIYAPDMTYSRAYETYATRDSAVFTADPQKRGEAIYYDNKPVQGTIKRGELFPYNLSNDSTGYKMSAAVANPLADLSPAEMKETQRIYNINCGVCHGAKGDGNGPVAAKVAGVANLTGGVYTTMTDGTMFHSITYGKGVMGSYASQVDRKQRWQLVKYIRTLQPKAEATPVATADTTAKKG